tara:strand:+ start:145 stop:372 length:228 start_codon:yes stop_codon:yes gene_type:complete
MKSNRDPGTKRGFKLPGKSGQRLRMEAVVGREERVERRAKGRRRGIERKAAVRCEVAILPSATYSYQSYFVIHFK